MDKITQIQAELQAPKNQFNSFGGYNYRSCEDILEALKPLLAEHGLRQTIHDEIVNIGSRYYVKAVIEVKEDGKIIETGSAYAREDEDRKKMAPAQLTGSASSYARKYALNGLWLIDDIKDADTDAQAEQVRNAPESKPKKIKMKPGSEKWDKAVKKLAEGSVTMKSATKHYDFDKKKMKTAIKEYRGV